MVSWKIQTFLHVSKALLQLVIYFWTKGKVIHKNNTGRQTKTEKNLELQFAVNDINLENQVSRNEYGLDISSEDMLIKNTVNFLLNLLYQCHAYDTVYIYTFRTK